MGNQLAAISLGQGALLITVAIATIPLCYCMLNKVDKHRKDQPKIISATGVAIGSIYLSSPLSLERDGGGDVLMRDAPTPSPKNQRIASPNTPQAAGSDVEMRDAPTPSPATHHIAPQATTQATATITTSQGSRAIQANRLTAPASLYLPTLHRNPVTSTVARLGDIVRDAHTIYHNSGLPSVVDPSLAMVATGMKRGVKRAAETLVSVAERVVTDWYESKLSLDDGLAVKRLKRLPIDPEHATSKAELTNTLPVDYLKSLPNDEFGWVDEPIKYLGEENHLMIRKFFQWIDELVQSDNWTRFPDITTTLDPTNLPLSVVVTIRTTGKDQITSIILHNWMFALEDRNDEQAFGQSGQHLLHRLKKFFRVHNHTYNPDGRLRNTKLLHLKPFGPLKFPYGAIGVNPIYERNDYFEIMELLQFFFSHRNCFNRRFPDETMAGIIMDLDAIHKDQVPPSYVNWPGKHRHIPGAFPSDSDENGKLIFDTVNMRDFEPARLWDHNHPSPSKKVTAADYPTPIRNAMRRNSIVYDKWGNPKPARGALRKAERASKKQRARFIGSPAGWYHPSINEPLKQRLPTPPTSPPALSTPSRINISESAVTLTVNNAREPEAAEAKERIELPTYLIHNTRSEPKITKKSWKNIDDFFENDDKGIWGKSKGLKLSKEKDAELEVRQQLINDGLLRSQNAVEAEKKRIEDELRRAEVERLRIEEKQRRQAEEELRRKQEEARRAAEDRIRLEDERLAATGQLRQPHMPVIPEVDSDWVSKAENTLHVRSNVELAKTPEGIALLRKDFETVVPQNQWLNDEIVNGALLHLGNYVNQKAGIKNPRQQTPKVHVFNSFVGKNIAEDRPVTQRMLRRAGIRQDTFLNIETVLIPICSSRHWTNLIIRPKYREIFHLDSLNPSGDPRLRSKALGLVRTILGDSYVESEWDLKSIPSPMQLNSDDCGVHTITNGMCIGLGIDPTSYRTEDMPMQRLRIAAVLLNEGFRGDMSLDGI